MYGEAGVDGRFVVTVIGVIDPQTADEFVRWCREFGRRIDVFDLRFVSLITAAGVTALLALAERRPCRVIASTIVAQVLEVTRVDTVLDVVAPDEDPQMDRASFGVAVHDSSLRFVYVNHAMSVINGAPEARHADRTPAELFDVGSDLDDVQAVLVDVLTTGQGRAFRVGGTTPSAASGRWTCSVRRSRYTRDARSQSVVIAMVSPDDSSDRRATHAVALSVAS